MPLTVVTAHAVGRQAASTACFGRTMDASAHTTAHQLQELQLRLDQEAVLAQC